MDEDLPLARLSITVGNRSYYFDRHRYYTRSGHTVDLTITNLIFTLRGHKPVPIQIVISPREDPAIHPVPGCPGWRVGSTEKATFVSERLTAPQTRSYRLPALPCGDYVLQLRGGGSANEAVLIVR